MSDDFEEYLSGRKLYGDDFDRDQIEDWHRDEQEGYANLGARDARTYRYQYHALNAYHGYRHLGGDSFKHILGLGSAYGDELKPVARRAEKIWIVEPSAAFRQTTELDGTPCEYMEPKADGTLDFGEAKFDLITCLGVLHHIPNVSFVVRECFRCLRAGARMLLREPIVSMGDWRHPRGALTKHERGIPIGIFRRVIRTAGFEVQRESLCVFPPLRRLLSPLGVSAYNSHVATVLDALLSRLFRWNMRYHRTNALQKIMPVSVYFVLRKPAK